MFFLRERGGVQRPRSSKIAQASKSLIGSEIKSWKQNPVDQFGSERPKKIFTAVPLSLSNDRPDSPTRRNKMGVPQDDNGVPHASGSRFALQRGAT